MTYKKLPPLKALAFVVCDTILDDKLTNKKSLIGLFNSIYSITFPCKHPTINVFVSLTEGHGEYQCSLSCVKDDTNKSIWNSGGRIKLANPLNVIELNFEIRGIVFPEAGIYRFEFLCEELPVISRKLQVVQSETMT